MPGGRPRKLFDRDRAAVVYRELWDRHLGQRPLREEVAARLGLGRTAFLARLHDLGFATYDDFCAWAEQSFAEHRPKVCEADGCYFEPYAEGFCREHWLARKRRRVLDEWPDTLRMRMRELRDRDRRTEEPPTGH